MQSLEIEVDVNESYIARVTPHQRVTATLMRIPVGRFRHTCERLFRRRTGKGNVKVRITFDRLDPRILPDMA